MDDMHQSSDHHGIPMTTVSSGKGREVHNDIFYYTDQIVNLIFIGEPDGKWVLIDAGMPNSGEKIISVAEERFGKGTRPEAILLTHGHFDHVGSIVHLLEHWKGIDVYAHSLEFPYLTGKLDYPPADPTVEGGGVLAKISVIYPHKAIDITPALKPLPDDGTVPFLSGWKWIHTPGHSTGHVSFFRESDRCLIAGDVFVTVLQTSLYKVLIQKEEVCGPPSYFTPDWVSAKESVIKMNSLSPQLAITGHGTFMEGEALKSGLNALAENFDTVAKPDSGRFV